MQRHELIFTTFSERSLPRMATDHLEIVKMLIRPHLKSKDKGTVEEAQEIFSILENTISKILFLPDKP